MGLRTLVEATGHADLNRAPVVPDEANANANGSCADPSIKSGPNRPRLPARLGRRRRGGVTKALQIIHKELDFTMAFCGHIRIETVDQSIFRAGTYLR